MEDHFDELHFLYLKSNIRLKIPLNKYRPYYIDIKLSPKRTQAKNSLKIKKASVTGCLF